MAVHPSLLWGGVSGETRAYYGNWELFAVPWCWVWFSPFQCLGKQLSNFASRCQELRVDSSHIYVFMPCGRPDTPISFLSISHARRFHCQRRRRLHCELLLQGKYPVHKTCTSPGQHICIDKAGEQLARELDRDGGAAGVYVDRYTCTWQTNKSKARQWVCLRIWIGIWACLAVSLLCYLPNAWKVEPAIKMHSFFFSAFNCKGYQGLWCCLIHIMEQHEEYIFLWTIFKCNYNTLLTM